MELLIAALIVVPPLACLGLAGLHVKRSLDRDRLAARDPHGASLLARIEAAVDRLRTPGLLSALPAPVAASVTRELGQLSRSTLPAIISERGMLISAGPTLAGRLRSSDLELEAFVHNLERLERTLLSRVGEVSRTSDLLRSSGEAVVHAQLVAEEIARLDGRPDRQSSD